MSNKLSCPLWFEPPRDIPIMRNRNKMICRLFNFLHVCWSFASSSPDFAALISHLGFLYLFIGSHLLNFYCAKGVDFSIAVLFRSLVMQTFCGVCGTAVPAAGMGRQPSPGWPAYQHAPICYCSVSKTMLFMVYISGDQYQLHKYVCGYCPYLAVPIKSFWYGAENRRQC